MKSRQVASSPPIDAQDAVLFKSQVEGFLGDAGHGVCVARAG